MPLNYLLHRHQVALMRAATSPSIDVQRTHEAFAAAYADRIEKMSASTGGKIASLSRI